MCTVHRASQIKLSKRAYNGILEFLIIFFLSFLTLSTVAPVSTSAAATTTTIQFQIKFPNFFLRFLFCFFYFHVCRLPYIAHFALIYFEYCNAKTKEIYVTISNIVISDCCLSRIFSLLPVPNLAQRFMHNLLK